MDTRITKLADTENIPGILNVLQQNLIARQKALSDDILERQGFLIHSFTHQDLMASIFDKENYIVSIAAEEDEVVGYTMGCNVKSLDPILQSKFVTASDKIKDIIFTKKVLYHRHIAKLLNKKNVGKQLLEFLVEHAISQNYQYMICQIAHSPIQNKKSILFHEKFGFVLMGSCQDKELTYGIYLKKLFE